MMEQQHCSQYQKDQVCTFGLTKMQFLCQHHSYATGGGCDMDNAIAVEDWENFDELSAHELSHLFGFVFKMCVLKRDYVRIGYYAKVFGGTDND